MPATPEGTTTYLVYENDEPDATKGNHWVDMPESIPHSRARLRADVSHHEAFITVRPDGTLLYDSALIEVEAYPASGAERP